MRIKFAIACLTAAWMGSQATSSLAADVGEGQWAWGIYGGAYLPDPDVLDDGPTGGLRLGYQATKHFAFSGSAGYASLDGEVGSGVDQLSADLDVMLVDLNVWYIFRPDARLSFTIGAGPGWAWVDGDVTDAGGNDVPGDIEDNSFTYNVALGPIIKLGERANLRLLTRLRNIEKRDDDDMDKEITLGVMFPLGGKKETVAPVAAAPPPPAPRPAPAPPPPPPPRDGDGDRVVDASDQCLDTPRGDRVDARGCSCDVTRQIQFALNSAELTDEGEAQLDEMAENLNRIKFVEGTVVGHTDSSGTEAYNQQLSQRRAQTIADYLQAKGIAQGRLAVSGAGETEPVADNETAEGRAQNRRVVLKRTDCDAGR